MSGRVFNQEEIQNLAYVVLVSQNFATTNTLIVGSVITLDNNVYDFKSNATSDMPDPIATQKYDFEIIGIFEPVRQTKTGNEMLDDQYKFVEEEIENRIYVSNRVVNEAYAFQMNELKELYPEEISREGSSTDVYYSTLYVLNDPLDLESFTQEVAAFLPEYCMIESSGSFDQVASPMKSIQGIASNILYVAVCAAVVTISLLVTLFLRDRRREIGIYLSLGERKIKIAGQILMEVVVVAVLAITLSLFSGNILSGGISEKMLTDQIVADQASAGDSYFTDLTYRGYDNSINSEELTETYKVSLNTITVILFYAIGLGTVCISTLVPIFYITRLRPKKILMEG
ncbi:MAG: ABC transporter permease [Peptococcaceae bacterium]|nr:ABC transporter permease [Peptococcaceae bacterium]